MVATSPRRPSLTRPRSTRRSRCCRTIPRCRVRAMSPELQTRHFDALGSTCELLSLGSGQAALERCERWVRDAEARFTRFLPDSELAGLNAGGGRGVAGSPQPVAMVEAGPAA